MSHEVLRRRMADDRAETERQRYVDDRLEELNRLYQEVDIVRGQLATAGHHVDRFDPDDVAIDREDDRERERRTG